jgi:hypothetical protein
MADRFLSVVKGEQMTHMVTEGASTSSEAIELRINDTVYANKLDVILSLQAIVGYLNSTETSPIA